MKLPLDFGVKLFFRMLLPGFLLALGLWPVILAILSSLGLDAYRDIAMVLVAIVGGWILVAADMPVYMLLEGRRYMPSLLRSLLTRRERRRLIRLNAAIDTFYNTPEPSEELRRSYLEASVDKRFFPIDSAGAAYVALPTRLGNTITSFETYSMIRYRLETIFYWPRIWVNLNKDLRDEIDSQQAIADSAVYSTVALGLTSVAMIAYAILRLLQHVPVRITHVASGPEAIRVPESIPSVSLALTFAAGALLAAWVVYRLAVFANQQFGTTFMAVVDTSVGKVKEYMDIEGVVAKVAAKTGIPVLPDEEFEVARRYLQYYNVKVVNQRRAVPYPISSDSHPTT